MSGLKVGLELSKPHVLFPTSLKNIVNFVMVIYVFVSQLLRLEIPIKTNHFLLLLRHFVFSLTPCL